MAKIRKLDLTKLTELVAPGPFMRIDPKIETRIVMKKEIYERIQGCIQFCYHLAGEELKKDEDSNNRRKYLRAALAEYASIEDAAKLELSHPFLKMIDLDDPKIHVVRLLRHANVHLSASNIQTTNKPARWKSPYGWIEFPFKVFFIPDIDCIKATDQAKCYNTGDLDAMITWLDEEQHCWGIQNVIIRTTEQYLMNLPL